jgi:hypothetical protein
VVYYTRVEKCLHGTYMNKSLTHITPMAWKKGAAASIGLLSPKKKALACSSPSSGGSDAKIFVAPRPPTVR